MGERWEYKVIYFKADMWTLTGLPTDLNHALDGYGAEGWELISTESIVRRGFFSHGSSTVGLIGFFKRKLGPGGRVADV